jgi:Peptidase A4 family
VKLTETNYLTNAWAGAGGKVGKWNTIIGTWVVPAVSKPSEPQGTEGGWNSSSWVGLDGYFISEDVLQAGVEQKVNAQGVASYYAWYEWFAPPEAGSPSYIWETVISNMPVAPGDRMTCAVQYVATTAGSLSLANNTTGAHFSITLAPPPGASFNGSTYEWIMEAPDGGEPTSSLPKFTPVVFVAAIACGSQPAANPATSDILNIENLSGKVLTAVSVETNTATIKFIG